MTPTILDYINELDSFFGVRDPVPTGPLFDFHRRSEMKELVDAIAAHMNIRARFQISVASKDVRFRSHHLVVTDDDGRGVDGIEAQVAIPSNLPLYGSSELATCSINIVMSLGFPKTGTYNAITILAHELSHVLLHSLRHPYRESEVFTDLVPIALGFGEIVKHGRKTSVTEEDGTGTHVRTNTYGYLSDADFSKVMKQVVFLRDSRQERVRYLIENIEQIESMAADTERILGRFAELKQELDTRRGRVRKEDVELIVAMHSADFTSTIETVAHGAKGKASDAKTFLKTMSNSKLARDELKMREKPCSTAKSRLRVELTQLESDVLRLARNCGFWHRLRTRL